MYHTHPLLETPLLAHGFFGRKGGVSEGMYAGLNCGVGSYDNAQHVAENRRRAAQALGATTAQLSTLYQVHSANVMTLNASLGEQRPQADGMVTRTPGVLLGILTADCAPILFADLAAGVIGAAHAGWKGAVGGIIESTVAAMEALGASRARISAAIGPTIAQKSYEVGPEFVARFTVEDRSQFFIPSVNDQHFMFDLSAYVAHRLRRVGVAHVGVIQHDTCGQETMYYSYRRATLRDEPDYGRQLSVIGLRE